jgi:predicted kinase
MTELTIIRGVSGSGKSTWGKTNYPDATQCEADTFFVDVDGNYNFDHTQLGKAHLYCLGQATKAILDNKDVVVANTNLKYWEFEPYLKLASQFNYKIHIVTLNTQFENKHGVSQEVVNHMRSRMDSIETIVGMLDYSGIEFTAEEVG